MTTQEPFNVVDQAPEFAVNMSTAPGRRNFSKAMRDLGEGQFLEVPPDMDIKSVRTMATANGKRAQPEPRKYSVRRGKDQKFWVSWTPWPDDEPYPKGRLDTRRQLQVPEPV